MQWVASTLHTTSEHDVSSITTADAAHLCCQQSTELTPTGRFKWTRPVSHERRILVSARVPLHFNWPLSRLHYRRNVQGVFFYTTAAVKMSVVTKMPAAFQICFHPTQDVKKPNELTVAVNVLPWNHQIQGIALKSHVCHFLVFHQTAIYGILCHCAVFIQNLLLPLQMQDSLASFLPATIP